MRGSSLNQAAASFYSLALKKLRASVRCPFCHTSKWRWFPVEFPVVPTYPKSEEKAITKTNNLSAKAGATNVTSNNGYAGGCFGGFHPSSMRVLRKPSISGGMVSSGCRTGWEGAA